MTPPVRILVLCTGNSARSQIAEALLNTLGEGRVVAESAGSHPAPRVNPLAIAVLREAGIDWTGRHPRIVTEVARDGWDLVLTVCDDAREACPVFPAETTTAHWGQPDPAAADGSEDERLEAFREALGLLSWRVEQLLALGLSRGAVGTHREAIRQIGRTTPGA